MSVPVYKFQDEFDGPAGSAPNPVNWTYDIGGEFASIAQSLMPNWVFGQTPLFIVLNLAVGGDGDGSIPLSTVFPATMLVDYVRVW